MTWRRDPWVPALLALAGCTAVVDGIDPGGGTGTTGAIATTGADSNANTDADATGGTSTDDGETSAASSESDGGGIKIDVQPDDFPPVDMCAVGDDLDGIGACEDDAPPAAFDPVVQWTWEGEGDEVLSIVTPLVANLTDDDGDGDIDLCDTPDVVVVATNAIALYARMAHLYVLDGASGTVHRRIETVVDNQVTPALGDIDGDGVPEIVTSLPGLGWDSGPLVAFTADGEVVWQGDAAEPFVRGYGGAIALVDVDVDGDVEIIAGGSLYDHLGARLWAVDGVPDFATSTAADLDGDMDLEIVLGHAAYHHDGTTYYLAEEVLPGFPQVANLDDDPMPEVLVTNRDGIAILEHDGTVVVNGERPTGDPPDVYTWIRPAIVDDLTGDGVTDFAVGSGAHFGVYHRDATLAWSADVVDASGLAASTAFDFLGDAVPEAMYADEHTLWVLDGETAEILMEVPRSSHTLTEYPVVADVDNDGSAEIVVVSERAPGDGGATAPTVQVIRDAQDRWIQARRIWNQHTYHVTNVREDGTIPSPEPHAWELLNTFRTNAQIEGGTVCDPAG